MNAVVCLNCRTFIRSYYRHDYASCECPPMMSTVSVSVDGGADYHRRGFGSESRYVEVDYLPPTTLVTFIPEARWPHYDYTSAVQKY